MDDFVDVIALYNYAARTSKEVSFNKGDIIRVFSRTNADWWDARVNGKFGFVPVPYVKVLERPQSVACTDTDIRRKSTPAINSDHLIGKRQLSDPASPTTPSPSDNKTFGAFNPTVHSLKSASTSSVVPGEHAGNVFAALDPTLNPAPSPGSIRRSGSDRSGVSGGRVNMPNRSNSDRIGTGSTGRGRGLNGAPLITEDSEQDSSQLQSTINKVSSAFATTKLPILPPSAAKQFNAAVQESQASLKHRADDPASAQASASEQGGASSGVVTAPVSRSSIKDRTKLFPKPIAERPLSALSKPKSQIQIEDPDKPEHVPSFKPPPPPTAIKPRPAKKNQELAAAVLSAAAKKQHEGKDNVTHL